MDGVHQGGTGAVLPVELVKTFACEHKSGYMPIVEADAGQVAAAGQQVGTQEDIRGLVVLDRDHLLDCKKLIFDRRCGRRRDLRHLLPGCRAINRQLAKVDRLMAFSFLVFCEIAQHDAHTHLTRYAHNVNIKNMGYTKGVYKNRRHGYSVAKEVSIMSLGNKIKLLRREKSWSQDELAYHAGIDGRQISRYENDKVTPSVEVVIKLASVRPEIAKSVQLNENISQLQACYHHPPYTSDNNS